MKKEELKKGAHVLGERVKELACFYGISESIRTKETVGEIFNDIVSIIPPSWQYPEITRVKVIFDDKEFVSQEFNETEWKQSAKIIVNGKVRGTIDVYYLEERPELDEGPFLIEERKLLNGVVKNINEAIERKEAEYEINTFFNTVAGGMRLIDYDFNIRKINNIFCEMVGLSENEIIGEKCYDIFWGEFCKTENCPLIKLQKSNDLKFEKEITKTRFDGKETPTILKAFHYKNIQGDFIGIVEDFKDITDRKQAEEKLKATNQQLDASNQQLSATEQQLRAYNQQLEASEITYNNSNSGCGCQYYSV